MRGRQALAVSASADANFGAEAGPASAARAVRIAGQSVAPGEARALALPLPGRADVADAIPVWVVAGGRAGPRVTVVAAVRGFEAAASRCAEALRDRLDAATVAGSVA